MKYDVAVVGGGPAGATCAALCAEAGLQTVLLEKATFPREKVCGDCLNPACWPLFDRLGVTVRVLALPHAPLSHVEFVRLDGRSLSVALPPSKRGEVAIKRSLFDQLLLTRAAELGAEIHEGCTVTTIERGWKIVARGTELSARVLVAADGRNSTVARLRNLLPPATRDRVALQTHVPAPDGFGKKVALCFLPHGYGGMAPVSAAQVNVCLVANSEHLPKLKSWTAERFALAPDQPWRTITPLARKPVWPVHENLLLIGDAARVIEPFTGEGIYYALASGELAARRIIQGDLAPFASDHEKLYRGRLWLNRLSRFAVTHPGAASRILAAAGFVPSLMEVLTGKVVRSR